MLADHALRPAADPALPIIALTASALPGDRELGLLAGIDDLLAKPFTREALAQLLARWLPADPSAEAAKAPASTP